MENDAYEAIAEIIRRAARCVNSDQRQGLQGLLAAKPLQLDRWPGIPIELCASIERAQGANQHPTRKEEANSKAS